MPAHDATPPMATAELIALLRLYVDMGVDLAVDEMPHDRFAEAPAESPPPRLEAAVATGPRTAAPAAPAIAAPAPPSPERAVLTARELAASASTLDELRAAMDSFEGCALKRNASRLVFADGNPAARVMLVGEAPGADEDRQGVPFVGRAGQLLDRMLAAIGLDRTGVYIANVVPWRPPGNRTPTPQETGICLPFIQRQIALCDPAILVCLGATAARTLLGARDGIMKSRGRWMEFVPDGEPSPAHAIRAIATLHPAYLLRQPVHKRLAWRDLLEVRKALDSLPDHPARPPAVAS